ncbi:MAG TPA: PH domain-containing protein, partial [Candidatus Limnocylindria bacterium]
MASNVDLLTGEEIAFSTEKHWIAPVRDSWIPILMFLGAFLVAWISPDSQGGIGGFVGNTLDLVRTGLFVGGIAWIGYNIAVWRSAKFAVTNRRVIAEEGLIGRRASATMLSSITDVQSRIPFIGNTLGYGD